jgi:hypothetical protein
MVVSNEAEIAAIRARLKGLEAERDAPGKQLERG